MDLCAKGKKVKAPQKKSVEPTAAKTRREHVEGSLVINQTSKTISLCHVQKVREAELPAATATKNDNSTVSYSTGVPYGIDIEKAQSIQDNLDTKRGVNEKNKKTSDS